MKEQYLEDLSVGQAFGTGRVEVTAEGIKEFARRFDFQPFHLDEDAAQVYVFRGACSQRLAHRGFDHEASARLSSHGAPSSHLLLIVAAPTYGHRRQTHASIQTMKSMLRIDLVHARAALEPAQRRFNKSSSERFPAM